MVEVLGSGRQVRRGIDAGKLLEVVNEMRLVEVAAAQGDLGPVNFAPAVDDLQYLLKTLDAAE